MDLVIYCNFFFIALEVLILLERMLGLKADFFTTLVIDDCIRRVNTRLLEVESDCSCRSGGSMAISF